MIDVDRKKLILFGVKKKKIFEGGNNMILFPLTSEPFCGSDWQYLD